VDGVSLIDPLQGLRPFISLDLVDVYVPSLAIFGNRWGGVVSFIPGRFTPGTHWLSGWVSLRDDLQAVAPPTEI
jgi:hypothetical protein